ncbi:hypothetical protein C8J57DRAFT_1235913 [Mycena rebaudengoi]|nr:hypothetical protein C8J57DRAFT_1235913 [Mycena rebaudengoi]
MRLGYPAASFPHASAPATTATEDTEGSRPLGNQPISSATSAPRPTSPRQITPAHHDAASDGNADQGRTTPRPSVVSRRWGPAAADRNQCRLVSRHETPPRCAVTHPVPRWAYISWCRKKRRLAPETPHEMPHAAPRRNQPRPTQPVPRQAQEERAPVGVGAVNQGHPATLRRSTTKRPDAPSTRRNQHLRVQKKACLRCVRVRQTKSVSAAGTRQLHHDSTGARAAVQMRLQRDGHRYAGNKAKRQTKDENEEIKKDNRERAKERKEDRQKTKREEGGSEEEHDTHLPEGEGVLNLDLEAAREDGRCAEEATREGEGEGDCGRADEYGKRTRTKKRTKRRPPEDEAEERKQEECEREGWRGEEKKREERGGYLKRNDENVAQHRRAQGVERGEHRLVRARRAAVAKEFCRRSKGEGALPPYTKKKKERLAHQQHGQHATHPAEEAHTQPPKQSRRENIIVGIVAVKKIPGPEMHEGIEESVQEDCVREAAAQSGKRGERRGFTRHFVVCAKSTHHSMPLPSLASSGGPPNRGISGGHAKDSFALSL